MVRLGADILFCLPDLVSIKLLGPKPQEDVNVDRSPAFIGNDSNSTSSIHPYAPYSHPSVSHNVFISGGVGTTHPGSEDRTHLDFHRDDLENVTLDREQDEAVVIIPPHSASSQDFSSSAPLQGNRSGSLSWNLASSLRNSSAAFSPSLDMSFSTFRPSGLSSNRRDGIFGQKQVRTERQSLKSSDKSEPASPLSQTELGDYLIGWSRYCPSLRVVQIDHRWWWERRFSSDQWALHVHRYDNSDKGKGREGAFS